MADDILDTSANDNTGASGGETPAPDNTGADTLLGGDAGKQAEGGEEQKPGGAPEEYADFTLGEGVEIDKATLEQVKADFKAAGYTQEQAQKAIDLHVANLQAQQEAFITTRKEWVDELKADKDFGGDKFDVTVTGAQNALRKFDTDGGMLKLLEASGFGDNPTVIKFLARVHKAMGEDDVHTERSRDNGKEPPLHERLYGKDGMGPQNP